MKRIGPGFLVILVLLVTLLRTGLPQPDLALEHGHEHQPGAVHADSNDPEHRHGDEDDHHDAPDAPCHHHDPHVCFGHGSVHMLAAEHVSLSSLCWQRFTAATLFSSSGIVPKKQFHVPLA